MLAKCFNLAYFAVVLLCFLRRINQRFPNGGFGATFLNQAQFRFYDLEAGAWKSYEYKTSLQDSHAWYSDVIDFKLGNGMAYVLLSHLAHGVMGTYSSYQGYGLVYDSKRKSWVSNMFIQWTSNSPVASRGPSPSQVTLKEGTISWVNGFAGYRDGKWSLGVKGFPDAYFLLTKDTGKIPLSTSIYDLSSAGTTWTLKKDVSQSPISGRNFSLQYSSYGTFKITQTVSNSSGTSSYSRDIKVAP